MGDLSGGSASSTSSSDYYSLNSTPNYHSPSSSEGLIYFGSDSPSSSSSVNQPSPLASSSSVNQPSPLASFSVDQPSPLASFSVDQPSPSSVRGVISFGGDSPSSSSGVDQPPSFSVRGVILNDSGTPSSSPSVNRPSPLTDDITCHGGSESISYQLELLNLSRNEDELLKAAIHEEMKSLMIDRDPDDVLVAAKRVHADSHNIPFLEGQPKDLRAHGIASKAFKIGVPNDAGLPGGGNPAGSSGGGDLANGGFAGSPLDPFSIHPRIPMNIGNYDFLFTNPTLSVQLALGLVILIIFFFLREYGMRVREKKAVE